MRCFDPETLSRAASPPRSGFALDSVSGSKSMAVMGFQPFHGLKPVDDKSSFCNQCWDENLRFGSEGQLRPD
jgi:hypothetical protein